MSVAIPAHNARDPESFNALILKGDRAGLAQLMLERIERMADRFVRKVSHAEKDELLAVGIAAIWEKIKDCELIRPQLKEGLEERARAAMRDCRASVKTGQKVEEFKRGFNLMELRRTPYVRESKRPES